MKRTFAITFFLSAILLIGLSAASHHKAHDHRKELAPGVIRIGDNLYYDQTEVANVHWREYMYWVRRVFGDSSEEFKATMPDTLVWIRKDSCLRGYSGYYHIPTTNYFPMVGISQKQAENFCKWRSDRVFERLLIEDGILKADYTQNRDHYFTIEKFYAGEYQGVKPDSNMRFYPNYRLPTKLEWRRALYFEDLIEHKYEVKPLPLITDVVPCVGNKWPAIVKPVDGENAQNIPDKKYPLRHLRGNVGEWASEPETSLGGGWIDHASMVTTQDTFHISGVNAWTGFRCAFEWRER
jgi:formylglycine-generating enzyme required for sulfatase activity